jgi:hypothetical protein
VQDHVKPELLFTATESGLYFTASAGEAWVKLTGGVPRISFRDLAIQERENDLVGASFGRGFFVLDDYSALRSISEEQLAEEATLFPIRKAWWYHPRFILSEEEKGYIGADHYVAPNPDFGAVFTYHLRDGLNTKEDIRQAGEKETLEADEDVPFPGWDAVADEMAESDPRIWIIVRDSDGNTVRRVSGPTKQGINRVAWDLRYPAPEALRLRSPSSSGSSGLLAAPGNYSATLAKEVGGEITTLNPPVHFEVVPLREGALQGSSPAEAAAFWRSYENSVRTSSAVSLALGTEITRIEAMKTALSRTTTAPGDLDERLNHLRTKLQRMEERLYGNRAKRQVGEKGSPTVGSRLSLVELGVYHSTYGPTTTLRMTLEIANAQLEQIKSDLEEAQAEAAALGEDLVQAGAPWVEGNPLPRRRGG